MPLSRQHSSSECCPNILWPYSLSMLSLTDGVCAVFWLGVCRAVWGIRLDCEPNSGNVLQALGLPLPQTSRAKELRVPIPTGLWGCRHPHWSLSLAPGGSGELEPPSFSSVARAAITDPIGAPEGPRKSPPGPGGAPEGPRRDLQVRFRTENTKNSKWFVMSFWYSWWDLLFLATGSGQASYP
jgi:hypothetical protein